MLQTSQHLGGAILGTKRHLNQFLVYQFTADYERNPDYPPQNVIHISKKHQPPPNFGTVQQNKRGVF